MKALVQNNATYRVFPRIVSDYNLDGISNQKKYKQLKEEEERAVLQKILPRVYSNSVELRELRKFRQEYVFLKKGKMGWIIRFAIWLKKIKKGNNLKYI